MYFISSLTLEENIEKVHDYSPKPIDNFKLIVVNSTPKLADKEKISFATCFGYSSLYQNIENSKRQILTHVLKRRNGKNSSVHPSTCALTPAENTALNICSIELK